MVKIKHCFRESTVFLYDVLYFIYIHFRYFKRYILKDKVVVHERTKGKLFFLYQAKHFPFFNACSV